MKKVLIIDDEQDARHLIRQYIIPFTEFKIEGECENGFEAVAMINKLEPDLIFLDIQMPGLSGFQVVQQMVHIPQIIFTTAYDQYALKAFDANALDYLLKPYTAERFNIAVAKALSQPNGGYIEARKVADEITGSAYPSRILVENGNKLTGLNTEDIIYLEADKDYTRIHTAAKSYLSNYGIGILEQRLNPSHFIRIHRSHIVNLIHIKEVVKEGATAQVILKNEKALNVSRGYMDEIKKRIF